MEFMYVSVEVTAQLFIVSHIYCTGHSKTFTFNGPYYTLNKGVCAAASVSVYCNSYPDSSGKPSSRTAIIMPTPAIVIFAKNKRLVSNYPVLQLWIY